MPMLLAALLGSAQAAPAAAPDLTDMVALYDEICLRTFPIDEQLDALMASKGAKAMTPEQVKVTLRDDPGRGWSLKHGGRTYTIFLELPPFHACSVRVGIGGGTPDLTGYRTAAAAFTADHKGFTAQKPMDVDRGDIHIHAEADFRTLPGGTGEQLVVIAQTITDPARRAKGETGTELRFVHQIKAVH